MGLKFKCDGTLAEELRSDHVTTFQEHQDKIVLFLEPKNTLTKFTKSGLKRIVVL